MKINLLVAIVLSIKKVTEIKDFVDIHIEITPRAALSLQKRLLFEISEKSP